MKNVGDMFSYKAILNECYRKNDNVHSLDSEELVKLQKCLLTIFKDISEVCQRNNIKVFLAGGTLLGAMRHGGVIPWDDDLDLAMMRNDYEKFKKIFQNELSEGYILKVPNYNTLAVNRFMQIYKKNTVYKTLFQGNPEIPDKVYIDIFPIDYAPNNKMCRFLKGMKCNILMAITGAVEFSLSYSADLKYSICKTLHGKIFFYSRVVVGKVFSFLALPKWYNCIDTAIKAENETFYCTSATGRKHYLGEVLETSHYLPLKPYVFEDINTWILNNSDSYLKNLYGEYMQIPPVNMREQHFVVELDV